MHEIRTNFLILVRRPTAAAKSIMGNVTFRLWAGHCLLNTQDKHRRGEQQHYQQSSSGEDVPDCVHEIKNIKE